MGWNNEEVGSMFQWIKGSAALSCRGFIAGVAIIALVAPNLALAQDAAPRAAQRQQDASPPYAMNDLGPAFKPGKPHVVVIDAGGTLTSRARDRISYLHYQGSVQGGVQTILSVKSMHNWQSQTWTALWLPPVPACWKKTPISST
jgi:hypothetical protein